MVYFKILNIIAITYSFILLFKHILTIFQQDHYDVKKLFKYSYKVYCHKLFILILIMVLLYFLFNPYHTIINLFICLFLVIKPPKYIVKLHFTKRIIRLTITYLIITSIIALLIPLKFINNFILINLLMPFLIIIVNYINYPVEKAISNKYIKQAKLCLDSHKNLIKIAITGSYGKTTVKNIINFVLEKSYLTLATPKSYNTILGLCKTINNDLKTNTEVLICEMGANHLNEINTMSSFILPHIACITEIGPQHLETFKTIDNIVKAKFEIINTMGFNKTIILNGDNPLIKNKKIISIKNVCYVGQNKSNNIYVEDIVIKEDTMNFNIIDKDNVLHICTHLLGIHNINNILIAYGVIKALKKYNIIISNKEFEERIKLINSIPHRLEYKKVNNFHIYDDSYNANIVGFFNAIQVMKSLHTKKVIITPGIVDTGIESESINKSAATFLLNNFDDIYLIKNKMTIFYQEVFDSVKEKYYIFNSFKEAYNYFKIKYKNEEVSLLIENDLPDNFLER